MAAHATTPFVVQDIRIDGLQRIEPGSVFAYLPIKQGDTFTDDKASEAIRALYATGFFNDVQIATEGNVVVVQVQERPAISAIDFSGLHEFDKDNLTKALRSVGLSQGRSYDKALVDKAEQELKRQYLTRGYYAAEVTTTVTPVDRNRVPILFSVAEGPSAKIRQINFVGNKAVSTSTLRDEMQLSTPNWFSWYTKSDLYAKEKLTGDLENVRSYYLNRGYLEFSIDSTQVSISPDKKDMYLTIAVHEGEPYKISSIKLSGNLLDREAELNKLIKIKPGERFSAEKLQATTKAIVDKLGEYGYAFAQVNAQPQIDQANHTVALTLQVDPSRRVYVRRVNIVGNTRTRDEVVRREMRQLESSWFDSSRLALSKDRVNRLGYFTDVDVTTTPVEGTNDQVDVDVKVAEKPTGAITLGAGFSSTDKVVLSAGVSQDNVFGSGTSLAVNVNTAKTYRTLTVTQVDPYFTIDGIKRITDVYYRTYQPLYYSTDSSFKIVTMGADTKFGIPFSEQDTVFFGVGAEQNTMDVDSNTPQSLHQLRERVRPRGEQLSADDGLVARQSRQRARPEPRLLHPVERGIRHAARQHDLREIRRAVPVLLLVRARLRARLQPAGRLRQGPARPDVPDLQELLRGWYRFGARLLAELAGSARREDERPDRRLAHGGRQHRADVPASGHGLRPHAARLHLPRCR